MVLCSRCRRSNIRTDPSAPTDANMSLPPPARLNAMSYTCTCAHTHTQLTGMFFGSVCTTTRCRMTRTSLSWAISWVFTCPETKLTRPSTWPVSNPQMVQVVSMLEVPARGKAKWWANQTATTFCMPTVDSYTYPEDWDRLHSSQKRWAGHRNLNSCCYLANIQGGFLCRWPGWHKQQKHLTRIPVDTNEDRLRSVVFNIFSYPPNSQVVAAGG